MSFTNVTMSYDTINRELHERHQRAALDREIRSATGEPAFRSRLRFEIKLPRLLFGRRMNSETTQSA